MVLWIFNEIQKYDFEVHKFWIIFDKFEFLKAPEQMFLKQPLEDLELKQMMQFLEWN